MPPEEIDRQVNAAASCVVVVALVAFAVHKTWKWLPWHPKPATVAKVSVAVVVVAGVTTLVHDYPAEQLIAAWAVVAVPVYLLRRYVASADDRAAREQRLRQARGHERRRAPPPLPPGQNPPGGTP